MITVCLGLTQFILPYVNLEDIETKSWWGGCLEIRLRETDLKVSTYYLTPESQEELSRKSLMDGNVKERGSTDVSFMPHSNIF